MKTIEKTLYRIVLVVGFFPITMGAQQVNFTQTNLVSDLPGLAKTTDPDLVNPWGVSFSSTSPFWVSDNHTGVVTLYNGGGNKLGLVVTIPPTFTGSSPTGQVFNSSSSFNRLPQ